MKQELPFEIDFDKIESKNIAEAVGIIQGLGNPADVDYVIWNQLGTYIYYYDGLGEAYYFAKGFIRIKGQDFCNKKDMDKCIRYLEQFKKL